MTIPNPLSWAVSAILYLWRRLVLAYRRRFLRPRFECYCEVCGENIGKVRWGICSMECWEVYATRCLGKHGDD